MYWVWKLKIYYKNGKKDVLTIVGTKKDLSIIRRKIIEECEKVEDYETLERLYFKSITKSFTKRLKEL